MYQTRLVLLKKKTSIYLSKKEKKKKLASRFRLNMPKKEKDSKIP